jgi:periplasmic protein TonB
MTPSKDTLEFGTPSGEATESQVASRPRQDAGRLRADAVSLEVPVKVHGSRVTEVVRGMTAHTEPFEEQAATMIVFPQGGVLKMTAALSTGQMVVITNLKSGQDAICRVGKVRPYGTSHSYVEIEFTQRQPGYWGVYFPSEGSDARNLAPAAPPVIVPAPASVAPTSPNSPASAALVALSQSTAESAEATPPSSALTAKSPGDAVVSSSPNLPLERRIQPNLPESRFVSIGSKEDIQSAVADTIVPKPYLFSATERKIRTAEAPKKGATIDPPAPTAVSSPISMAELQGDSQVTPWESAPTGEANLATAGTRHSAPQELFGVRLDPTAAHATGNAADGGRKWLLVVAGAALLIAAIGGGAYYFYGRPAAKHTNAVPPQETPPAEVTDVQSSAPQPVTSSGVVPAPVAQLTPASPNASMASEPAITVREPVFATAKPSKAPPTVASQPTASTPPKNSMANMSSSLAAHPVSARSAVAARSDAAPTPDVVAAGNNSGGEAPGLASPTLNLVAPSRPTPESPLRVGGDIKAPRLISTSLPVYPAIARQAGVEGNVIVDTVVDKDGNVTSMKVLSGPPMLRQPAVDALREWKYHPGTLNGDPVAVEITVSIQFHR